MSADSTFIVCLLTLRCVFGVPVHLAMLPVQVRVPGLELQAVERLDVEVRSLDLNGGNEKRS